MKIIFYLVRHGQTFFNKYNKLQGWSNSPLTKEGIKIAKETGEKLSHINFFSAFCSDTPRASKTAQIILKKNKNRENIPLITLPNFREEFYGSYEGSNMDKAWLEAGAPYGLKTYKQIVMKFGLSATKDLLKKADPWHDAENNKEYWQRMNKGFEKIIKRVRAKRNNKTNVLLISHGNTLLSLADKYGRGKIKIENRPKNGSISKLLYNEGKFNFITFNDHLLQ